MPKTSSNGSGSTPSSSAASSLASNDVSSNDALSTSNRVVVCQEVFDENSQPTYDGEFKHVRSSC